MTGLRLFYLFLHLTKISMKTLQRIARGILLPLFFLVGTTTTYAQPEGTASPFQVTGRIINATDNSPIEFASLVLFSAYDSIPVDYTASDASGEFKLSLKNEGEYFISVTFIGYKPLDSAPFMVSTGKSSIRLDDLRLEEDEQLLSEVVVTGRKRQVVYKLDKQVIEAADFLSAAGGTAADILMQSPSIRVDAEGEITFRGSSGCKVYVDGKPSSVMGRSYELCRNSTTTTSTART